MSSYKEAFRRSLMIVCSLFIFVFQSKAQKFENTLLWRISGKGIKENSYLYGTFHVNDKKVFQLGDSVLEAIKGSTYFANEVDADSFLYFYFIGDHNEFRRSKKLKDILSKSDYDSLKKTIYEKTKRPADLVSDMELLRMAQQYKPAVNFSLRKGMSTFLDLWLFSKAREYDKTIIGLEYLADPSRDQEMIIGKKEIIRMLEAIDPKKEIKKNLAKEMLDMYLSQNIDSMYTYFSNISFGSYDSILKRRNILMCKTMDSIVQFSSGFFAAGAAHLAGDFGLIQIMRNKGYTVTPVYSSKKIQVDDYKLDEDNEWLSFADTNNLFSVDFLGQPINIKNFQESNLNSANLFLDAGNNVYYFCGHEFVPRYKGMSSEDKLDEFAESNRKNLGAEISDYKDITINGVKGKQFALSAYNGYSIMNVFERNNTLYLQSISSANKKLLNKLYIDKFFNSFRFKEEKPNVWHTMSFPEYYCKLDIVDKPYPTFSDPKDSTRKSIAYDFYDSKNNVQYNYYFSRMRRGNYVDDDSLFFDDYKNNIKSNFVASVTAITNDDVILDKLTYFKKDDSYGQKFRLISKNANINIWYYSIIRDGYAYYLSAYTDTSDNTLAQIEKYFASLTFTKIPATTLHAVLDTANNFKTDAPSNFISYKDKSYLSENEDDEKDEMYFYSEDSLNTNAYIVSIINLGDYVFNKSDSILIDQKSKYNKYYDSLISSNFKLHGDYATLEQIYKGQKSNKIHHDKYLLNGNKIYGATCIVNEKTYLAKQYKAFIDNFTLLNYDKQKPYKVNKACLIATDLSNKNEDIRKKAQDALSKVQFEKSNITCAIESFRNEFYDNNEYDYASIRAKIYEQIVDSLNPENIQLIKTEYLKSNEDMLNKNGFYYLAMLARMKHKDADAVINDLIGKKIPKSSRGLSRFSDFYEDSTQYTKGVKQVLLRLAKDSIFRYYFDGVIHKMLDKQIIDSTAIEPDLKQHYLKLAIAQINSINDDEEITASPKVKMKDLRKSFAAARKASEAAADAAAAAVAAEINDEETNKPVESFEFFDPKYEIPYYQASNQQNALRILSHFKNDSLEKMFSKLFDADDKDLQTIALCALLKQYKKTQDYDRVLEIADDLNYRSSLYTEMKDNGLLKYFPNKFKKQSAIAESELYVYANNDDSPLITLFDSTEHEYEGKQYRFYAFKVQGFEGDEDVYLGIGGAFDLDKKELACVKKASGVYYKKNLDEKNWKVQLQAYLKEESKD